MRRGSGALSRMPGGYILFGVGIAPDPASVQAVRQWLATMKESLRGQAGGLYLNFTEKTVDPAQLFPADVYQRLRAVRASVDPRGLIRANHEIPAARG